MFRPAEPTGKRFYAFNDLSRFQAALESVMA